MQRWLVLSSGLFVGESSASTQSLLLGRLLTTMSEEGPVAKIMRSKLTTEFNPVHLEVVNESHMHNVPRGSETHFKVLIVSDVFRNESAVKRHRLVNHVLDEELKKGVHALSIVAKTSEQWSATSNKTIEASPNCKGGFGK